VVITNQRRQQAGRAPVDVGEVGVAGLVDLDREEVVTRLQIRAHVQPVHALGVGVGAGRPSGREASVDPQLVAAVRGDEQLGPRRDARQPEDGRAKVEIGFMQIKGMGRADPEGVGGKNHGSGSRGIED